VIETATREDQAVARFADREQRAAHGHVILERHVSHDCRAVLTGLRMIVGCSPNEAPGNPMRDDCARTP